jgi:protein arginine N-methyltransferase 1
MYRLIDYGAMVRDRRRIEAYTRALAAVVTPSSVVLDLGAGIGTFSVLACRLGAARVYAVEPADVISVAAEVARANGVADRIRFLQARGAEVELPEQVDVIISDLAGALPLFEEHLPSIIAARERFLKPGGVLIPQRDRLFCAPVSSAALYESITGPWHAVPDVDLTPARTMALQTPHARAVTPDDLAGEPRVWGELDYATLTSCNVSASLEWPIASTVHAIALWFETTTFGDATTSSGPWSPESVHATMLLPLAEPLDGRMLRLTLEATLAAGYYVTTWHASTDRAGGVRQSTFLGDPRSTASLIDRTDRTEINDPSHSSHLSHSSEAAFRVCERVLARCVAEELLLLDPATGVYHVLNETGAQVWQSLQEGARTGDVAALVADRYGIDAARAAGDVASILAELQEANLIEAMP